MNTIVQINDTLAHAPAGVVAMLFAIAFGYVLKSSSFFPNNRIPAVVVPTTALMYALIQLCADMIENKPKAGYYFIFNFMLGFVYGAIAWLLHAQLLRRFLDPKMFNDDGSTKFFTKPSNPTDEPTNKP